MLVAVPGSDSTKLPKIGKIHSIVDTRYQMMESTLVIEWLIQDQANISRNGCGHLRTAVRILLELSDIVIYYYMIFS